MKVVIDARLVVDETTGMDRYLAELVARYPEAAPRDTFVVFVMPSLSAGHPLRRLAGPRLAVRNVDVPAMGLGQWWRMRSVLGAEQPDVYHYPHFDLPRGVRTPSVITIHDLKYVERPDFFPGRLGPARAMYVRAAFRSAVRRATEIIVDSEYSRQRLMERFHVSPERLHTVLLGASVIPSTGAASGITGPYILSVGERRLHKNLETLIEAFAGARAELPAGCRLVIVGKPYRDYRGPERAVERLGLGDAVVILGFVPDATLAALYDGASALAFPSFYEGFGLPLLEAMTRGVPIACSKATCLPEILGGAGVLVDPGDLDGWRRALVRVTTDAALRATLIAAGHRRLADFDWRRTAAETLAVYRRCAERHGVGASR